MAKLIGMAFRCVFVVSFVFAPLAAASYPQGDLNGNCRVAMPDLEILAAQ